MTEDPSSQRTLILVSQEQMAKKEYKNKKAAVKSDKKMETVYMTKQWTTLYKGTVYNYGQSYDLPKDDADFLKKNGYASCCKWCDTPKVKTKKCKTCP